MAAMGITLLFSTFWNSSVFADQFGDFTYTVSGASVTITDYPTNAVGVVNVPNTIVGKPVTQIGSSAFNGCTYITSVSIPLGVTVIGDFAFQSCVRLTNVNIPLGVTTIGGYAFQNCSLLTTTIPAGVTSIGAYAFNWCRSLTTPIPAEVTYIGQGAFNGCSSLVTVTIPNGVTKIYSNAFSGCWGLTNVEIPSGVTSIGSNAFSECWRLTHVTIPVEVASIGDSAFSDCSSLGAVVIPANVTVISTHAFAFCTNLSSVVCLGTAPSMGANVFYGTKSGLTIYYYSERSGFTSPTWYDRPSFNLGAWNPIFCWMLDNGFPPYTDVLSDPNFDGVNLLMAYALGLNPRLNLAGRMPKPVLSEQQMSFTFYAGSEGITYAVETSADLRAWAITSLSSPDQNQRRTATVQVSGSRLFMRLVVSQ